jgi:hypothetical protein
VLSAIRKFRTVISVSPVIRSESTVTSLMSRVLPSFHDHRKGRFAVFSSAEYDGSGIVSARGFVTCQADENTNYDLIARATQCLVPVDRNGTTKLTVSAEPACVSVPPTKAI